MSESKEMLVLRGMAWQRAKGELKSILETYWGEYPTHHPQYDKSFDGAKSLIDSFIEEFENNYR